LMARALHTGGMILMAYAMAAVSREAKATP
jgi:hypothetical protein